MNLRYLLALLPAALLNAQPSLLLNNYYSSYNYGSVQAAINALQAQVEQLQFQVFELQAVEMERRFGKTMRQVDNSKLQLTCDFERKTDHAKMTGYAILLPRSRWVSIAYDYVFAGRHRFKQMPSSIDYLVRVSPLTDGKMQFSNVPEGDYVVALHHEQIEIRYGHQRKNRSYRRVGFLKHEGGSASLILPSVRMDEAFDTTAYFSPPTTKAAKLPAVREIHKGANFKSQIWEKKK